MDSGTYQNAVIFAPMSAASLAILASGAGSNARCIAAYFSGREDIRVVRIYTNRADAGVIQVGAELGIPVTVFGREEWQQPQTILDQLHAEDTDWIVLAGFLWKVPAALITAYPGHIINIHPALLPAFGGKGMYGMHVHRAVKESGATRTGITIHQVNEHYDEGAVIFQESVAVRPEDTPEDIAARVQQLEHYWFPRIIERLAKPA